MEVLTAIVLGMCFENCADPRGFLQVQEFYQDYVNPSSYCTAGPIDVKNCLSIGSLDGVTIEERKTVGDNSYEANYNLDGDTTYFNIFHENYYERIDAHESGNDSEYSYEKSTNEDGSVVELRANFYKRNDISLYRRQ